MKTELWMRNLTIEQLMLMEKKELLDLILELDEELFEESQGEDL
jgi:hypothetical protein